MKEDILVNETILDCDVAVKADGEKLTVTVRCPCLDWVAIRQSAVEALRRCLRGQDKVNIEDMAIMELTDTARASASIAVGPEGEAVLHLELTPCGEGGHRIECAVDEALLRGLLARALEPDPHALMPWLPGIVELAGPLDCVQGCVVARVRASWLLKSMCRGLHRTPQELNDASAAIMHVASELDVPVWGRREDRRGLDRCLIELGFPPDAAKLERLDEPSHVMAFLASSLMRGLEEAGWL